MKHILKTFIGALSLALVISSCDKTDYTLGDLTPPSDLVINTTIVGADATHPTGDSSGVVNVSIDAKGALSYRIDWDATDGITPDYISSGSTTSHRYTEDGLHSYTITVLVTGKGGTTTATASKVVNVYTKFVPDPLLVKNLTNNTSKIWAVDKDAAGHFGVGPYNSGSIRPEWYAAGPNEKAQCCACFYSARFTFTQVAPNVYTLTTTAPNGAFTKTGSLTTLPGVPASGDEGCYSGYTGGTSSFTLIPASSGAPKVSSGNGNFNSTQTSIKLAGVNTFIGYGAVLKEYEILTIDENYVLLRVQGTETGNAWYLRLKAQ